MAKGFNTYTKAICAFITLYMNIYGKDPQYNFKVTGTTANSKHQGTLTSDVESDIDPSYTLSHN